MPRVFLCLAIGQILVLLGTGALGVVGGEENRGRHIVLALFSLVLSCLIQVVLFTYFTVTGKMIGQAVHLGRLSPELLLQVKRFKRSVTHLLVAAIVSVLVVTSTGAVLWRDGGPATIHLSAAGVVLAAHVYVLLREYGLAIENSALLTRTIAMYQNKRRSAR